MKNTIFFLDCVLVFFLFTISESAGAEVVCSVVDLKGHEISSAMSSDIVFLVAAIPVKRPMNIVQNRSSPTPLRRYTISQTFNGHFYHEGGVGTEYHKTVVWIPDSSYIHAVTVKPIFPGIGKCTKTLAITH